MEIFKPGIAVVRLMPGVREVGQVAVAHMGDDARHRGSGSEERRRRMNFEGSLKLSLLGTQNLGEIYS